MLDSQWGLKQISPEGSTNQLFVQPRQKRLISITFRANNRGQTLDENTIRSVLRLSSKNAVSNVLVLLNSKRDARLDATRTTINVGDDKNTSPTFVVTSYDVNANGKGNLNHFILTVKTIEHYHDGTNNYVILK